MSTMAHTTKKRPRRSFTDDFKAGAVRLVLEQGKTVAAAARDLDLTESSLRNWVEQARTDAGRGKLGALTTAEREELSRLRKENRILQEEREILKNGRSGPRGPDLWTRNSRLYARAPGAVAVRFLVTSEPVKKRVFSRICG